MNIFSRNVELYDFSRGARHWAYCDRGRDVTLGGLTYQYSPIKRGSISESADVSHNTLDITASQDLPFLDQFRGSMPMEPIGLTVRKQNAGNGSVAVIWIGEVGGVEFGTSAATIHGLPPLASLQALGLKRSWQKSCPHVVYGAGLGQCNASRAAMQTSATLTTVTGNVVHAAAFAGQDDGWWSGGYIEWQVGEATERRFISAHVGDMVILLTPALVAVGTVVTALPGCDHSLATCDVKFKNSDNYGGQPFIPEKNPMGPESIY